ncbi:winged helix-turn-helix transcriptional regulator [Sphingobium nicotianae]|uniref:Winged helix-turn-helix transcriptional regulator n=1 Tax=Sphingobium nicotianae TaxID=2782607 RepID=A0A9X1DFW2_9SPHN|nr:winged helix-turn-helix transcriptional regulator [Sphingobium nicotianae]MBT2189159.1 winged helix-turn-helix transcriptional regulator [Sphingobium nicotianae]
MSSNLSPDLLQALSKHRWAVVVLAHMAERGGGRFAEMANRIGAPRDSLRRTLAALIAQGWIMPNPGHGHPLRPDYLLTEAGRPIGSACRAIVAAQAKAGMPPQAVTRWSLPLLRLIGGGEARFNRLERAMEGATPRAVAASLKALIAHDLVARDLVAGFPPSSAYRLTGRGEVVARALS